MPTSPLSNAIAAKSWLLRLRARHWRPVRAARCATRGRGYQCLGSRAKSITSPIVPKLPIALRRPGAWLHLDRDLDRLDVLLLIAVGGLVILSRDRLLTSE